MLLSIHFITSVLLALFLYPFYGFNVLHLEKAQKILEEMGKYDESYEFELGVISELN